jgi:hypothetical protein
VISGRPYRTQNVKGTCHSSMWQKVSDPSNSYLEVGLFAHRSVKELLREAFM